MRNSSGVLLVLLLLNNSSCNAGRARGRAGPDGQRDGATAAPGAQATARSSTCRTTRLSLPSIPGWLEHDLAPEECISRDLIWKSGQDVRFGFCTPAEELQEETLLPHAARKGRLTESRGRDALVNSTLAERDGIVNGEIGVRFLSEGGAAWGWARFNDLPLEPAREAFTALLHADAKPMQRPPRGTFTWGLYQQECFAVRDILKSPSSSLINIPTYPDTQSLFNALVADSPRSTTGPKAHVAH